MGFRGQWLRPDCKRPVEECLRLQAKHLLPLLESASPTTANVRWGPSDQPIFTATVRSESTVSGRRILTVEFAVADIAVAQSIVAVPVKQPFGGVRWVFTCPGPSPDQLCGKAVWMLYLPGGETRFACRDCHELTYRSRQTRPSHNGSGAKFVTYR